VTAGGERKGGGGGEGRGGGDGKGGGRKGGGGGLKEAKVEWHCRWNSREKSGTKKESGSNSKQEC